MIVACGALVAFWTRETTLSIPEAESDRPLPRVAGLLPSRIRDYLSARLHGIRPARSVSRRGSAAALSSGELRDVGAVLLWWGACPPLETATTFWTPTGLLLCVLATYAYGCALGGGLAGLAAVTAVFLFPDPSTYALKNRFLSFSWLMQVSPGSGYALALTFRRSSSLLLPTGGPTDGDLLPRLHCWAPRRRSECISRPWPAECCCSWSVSPGGQL